jgi:chromate transporter
MSPLVLYLVLLKATLTSFSGLASLPILRNDLVIGRQLLTDEQLNTAVVVSRTTPGPVGVYVVSVGYAVGGFPGAVAGWAAMCTPAFLILPLMHLASRQAAHHRMRGATQAVVAASAGLLIAAVIPVASETLSNTLGLFIAVVCTVLMLRRVSPLWLVIGAGTVGLILAVAAR